MPRTTKKPAEAAEPKQEAVVEKPVAEKAAPKKSLLEKAVKKTAAKKDAPKKAAGKVEEVYLEVGEAKWNISDCKARAIAAYVAEGHRESSVKKLAVYLKPEDGKAYYVINDDVNGSIDL